MLHQCRLEQHLRDGEVAITHGWIDAKGAKIGAQVELKGQDGLWTVTSVGVPGVEPEKHYHKVAADRKQRSFSDI